MNTPKTLTSRLARFVGTGLLAAAAVTILAGGAIAPAFADDGQRGGREVRTHEWRDHERFEQRRHVMVAPRYGYAYPDPYHYGYAPAWIHAEPSFNLDFSFR